MTIQIPSNGLFIDVPGKGTALLWFHIMGDQYTDFSLMYPRVAWKGMTGDFSVVDYAPNDGNLLFTYMAPFQFVRGMAQASGIDVSKWSLDSGSVAPGNLGPREIIDFLLTKPRAEADTVFIKWWQTVGAPKISAFLTKVLGDKIGGASTPVGGYQNLDAYFTARLAALSRRVEDGKVIVTV